MTAREILAELKPLGSDGYKKVLFNHGVKEPCFGVKISDLKLIQKRIKMDYQLALDLYDTGNYDAMYLAGLIADDARMTKRDLQRWVKQSYGFTVPWVAAGGHHGWELALEWIDAKSGRVAAAGWATLANLVSIKEDTKLDLAALKRLLQRVQKTIHQQSDEARYQMNGFVIGVGAYVKSLTGAALQTAEKIGPVTVDMGNTACQVPFAPDYIRKVQKRGAIGKKRKSCKC
ncbi:MAG TPA: DNA alkylation repair protein [Chthoniobacterales bacterium]|nr:DNA alkylation repair protein [Chthoniobacterales bacterium]